MEDFNEIKNAIGDLDQDVGTDTSLAQSTESITITSSDPIMNLQNQVMRLTAENAEMRRLLNDLRGKVLPIIAEFSGSRPRSKIKLPKRDLFGPRPPTSDMGDETDTNSVVDVGTPSSVRSISIASRSDNVNPFTSMIENSASSPSVFKSNSAVAPQGYVGKKSVWGTALASYLVAATRYYIAKTNTDALMIDERALVRNCTMIAPVLYEAAVYKSLPTVKDPQTSYLATAISRMDKNDVPVSDAKTWTDMLEYQDGKDVLYVINTIIKMAMLVPEAVSHPVSQIIPILVPPVSRVVDGKSIFAMSASGSVRVTPSQWEVWCSILKEGALTKYIKYRLSNMKETQVVAKMVSEIRPEDMVEKKNHNKIREIAPFTIRR